MKVVNLLMCIVISTITSMAQVKISGTVIDANTHSAIEFANIALLTQDSVFVSGTSSDTEGLFAFKTIQEGKYLLSGAFVGYKKMYVPVYVAKEPVNLGAISMEMSDVSLKDVTVTANSIVQKSDRKIIIPSEAQIKASNSGVTLLRNLQLSRIVINPINNTISIPGGDEVQLRINGVEVTINEIVALQPTNIIRIEYHDEPGMRYGNAAAVIDYITRRKDSGGNISTNLTNVLSKAGISDNFMSGKVNHKRSEFGVNAYWRYRDIDWTRQNKETFVFPDKTLLRKEIGEPTKFKENNLNLSLNYNLNEADKYLFNVTFRNNLEKYPNSFTDRKSLIYSSDNPDPLTINDHTYSRSNASSLDLYYQKNMRKDQMLIFNVVGTYIDSKNKREYQEYRNDILNTDILSNIVGDKYSLIAEGIYEKKIAESKFSAGMKHTQSYTNNVYSGNVATSLGLNFAETYAYIEYQMRKSKFNYTFGLGTMRTYNSQGGEHNEKYIFRPTLRVSYNINENTYVRYNGYISGYSPSLSDLNNVEQPIDSLQIRRGNPNLNMVWYYTHTLNAGFNKGILGAEFFMRYSYDHKPIMEQITLENGKFVRANVNQKGFHRLYLETTFKVKPLKDIITLSVAPRFSRFISQGDDYTHTFSTWGVRGALNVTYKKWYFTAEGYTRWKNFWGEEYIKGETWHMIMLGYNASKWSLGVGAYNPFMKTYDQNTYNYSKLTPNQSYVFTDKAAKLLVVSFSLNLNFGRQFKAGDKRLNNDDTDSGIMTGSKK